MIANGLALVGRHGRRVLVAGLAAGLGCGLVAPGIAAALERIIAPLVVVLLFLAVLRLGVEGVRAGLGGLGGAIGVALVLQLLLPLGAALAVAGWGAGSAVALWFVLMLAASPISGAPSLTILVGGDPVPALRQLVLGTMILPLTVAPVFLILPALGDPATVAWVVVRLMAVIVLAGGLALALRARGAVGHDARTLAAIDGLAALVLAVVVIALMGRAGPALAAGGEAWGLLALLMAVNLALQLGAALVTVRLARGRGAAGDAAAAMGIVAGNRNVALFLSALPAALAEDLLLFFGLYQIPMYLTPLLLAPLYRRLSAPSPNASRQ